MSYDPTNNVNDVRVCCGCLALQCRLYDIREKQLEQVFSDLTGLPVSGGLLCCMCLQLVYKFNAFRVRCWKSTNVLNNMFLINQDTLSSVDRSNIKVPLCRSRIWHVHCGSTKILSISNVLYITIPSETSNNIEQSVSADIIEYTDIKEKYMVSDDSDDEVVEPNINNEKIYNETDIDNVEDIVETNIDDVDDNVIENILNIEDNENTFIGDTNDDDNTENVIQKTAKRTKYKMEMKKNKLYFTKLWRSVKSLDNDYYQLFERLYRFSLLERPSNKKINKSKPFNKKNQTGWEEYQFMKFLEIYKKFANLYKVDVEFISIMEEKRAMAEKRKLWTELNNDLDCAKCGRKYLSSSTSERHRMRSHNEAHPFRCEVCLYTFPRKCLLAMHLLKFHATKRRCKQCNMTILTIHNNLWEEVHNHIRVYHLRTGSTCKFCGKTFTAAKHCYYHIRQTHRGEMNAVQCLLCGDSYNGANGVRIHTHKLHIEAVKCPACGVYYKDRETMAAHLTGISECQIHLSGCPMCGATFPSKSLMKEHYDDIHAKYKCEKCLRTFIEYECYRVHLYRICSVDEEKLPKPVKKNKNDKSVCHVCGKVFKKPSFLIDHLRMHTGEKPYKCEYCDKSFRMRRFLVAHKRTHTGERSYLCTQCPKAFRQHSHLRKHMTTHSDKRFTCDICEKQYASKPSLTHHIQSVHMRMPRYLRDKGSQGTNEKCP